MSPQRHYSSVNVQLKILQTFYLNRTTTANEILQRTNLYLRINSHNGLEKTRDGNSASRVATLMSKIRSAIATKRCALLKLHADKVAQNFLTIIGKRCKCHVTFLYTNEHPSSCLLPKNRSHAPPANNSCPCVSSVTDENRNRRPPQAGLAVIGARWR